jgi:hypothetical protein
MLKVSSESAISILVNRNNRCDGYAFVHPIVRVAVSEFELSGNSCSVLYHITLLIEK